MDTGRGLCVNCNQTYVGFARTMYMAEINLPTGETLTEIDSNVYKTESGTVLHNIDSTCQCGPSGINWEELTEANTQGYMLLKGTCRCGHPIHHFLKIE